MTGIPEPDPVDPIFDDDWGDALLASGVEFADNPEPRCPCVLLLDTSKSMTGKPIQALNDGLLAFHDDLVKDPLARRRVEVAVVTFGGAPRVVQNFVTVDDFPTPILSAGGATPMGGGIHQALDLLEARKAQYQAHGVSYYRPWVFLITDGARAASRPRCFARPFTACEPPKRRRRSSSSRSASIRPTCGC